MKVEHGDTIYLYSLEKSRGWIVRVERGRFSTDLGTIDLSKLVGVKYGSIVKTNKGKPLLVTRPGPTEYIMRARRPTQIIYPKDIGYIIHTLGIRHDSKVLEVGTGSGGLTTGIAWIMSRDGEITTYERRDDFRETAKKNLENIRYECSIRFRGEFPDDSLEEEYYDAAFIDIDTPWDAIPHVHRALKGYGRIGILLPTYSQLEKIHDPFKKHFAHIETVEIFLRNIRLSKGKIRPEFRMIGYTAVLVIGIKKEVEELTT